MNRNTLWQIVTFAILVGAGVELRLWFEALPNFAPVAAIALFAGYLFPSRLVAVGAPLSVMLISDYRLDKMYDWYMMAVVYGALAMPVLARGWVRRMFRLDRDSIGGSLASVGGLTACSLASSLFFFVTTNFAAWLCFDMYEPTWRGLGHCFAMALPFFRYTLTGDLFFATVLFGTYGVVQFARQHRRSPANEPALAAIRVE